MTNLSLKRNQSFVNYLQAKSGEITLNEKDIEKKKKQEKKREEREKRLRDLWKGEDDKTADERVIKEHWDDDDDDDALEDFANKKEESMKGDITLEVKLQVVRKERSVDKKHNIGKKTSNEDDYLEDQIKEKEKKMNELRKIALDRNICAKKKRRRRPFVKKVSR